jgi:hypothetical protein
VKVFVSSLIANFGAFRNAAKVATTTLRHEPLMAEDFGAQPNSPQIACLQGLRKADVVVLVLGEHYGAKQPGSGLSATHEEYRDAKGRKPVIAFVQEGVTPDPDQAAFIREVQGWEGGLFRGGFREATDLQQGVTRALHDYELTKAVGPVDADALVARACGLLPRSNRDTFSGTPVISIAVAGGPSQQILRPVELEAAALTDSLHQAALFGDCRIFDRAKGVETEIEGVALILSQDRGASIRLDEQGALLLSVPVTRDLPRGSGGFGLPVLIEEDVQQQLGAALNYAAWVMEHIDPTQRLTHVAVAAMIAGADHMGWRTQREHAASPHSMTMGMASRDRLPVSVSRARAALRLDHAHLIEDLLVPLRRQLKS